MLGPDCALILACLGQSAAHQSSTILTSVTAPGGCFLNGRECLNVLCCVVVLAVRNTAAWQVQCQPPLQPLSLQLQEPAAAYNGPTARALLAQQAGPSNSNSNHCTRSLKCRTVSQQLRAVPGCMRLAQQLPRHMPLGSALLAQQGRHLLQQPAAARTHTACSQVQTAPTYRA